MIIFSVMNQEEEISQLRSELFRLQQQTKEQYRQITELQQRLNLLMPEEQRIQFSAPSSQQKPLSLENFIGLRLIHFIGIVVLVIGLSIGVKYAIDRNLISEVVRIALAYAAGGILFFLSLRLKKNYELFSAILLSGGLASLYFTTYAAYVYYHMMPFAVAYGIMVVLTIYTVYQAIVYNRELIAILGLAGAYAIPFLISPNTGNPNLFFLYIFIINLGILYLGWRKAWNATVTVAQLVTWVLYFGWGFIRMNQQWLVTGWVFLILFFAIFYAYAMINGQRVKSGDGTSGLWLLNGNNLMFYFGCLMLVDEVQLQFSYAWVTLAMSGFLVVQALFFYYLQKEKSLGMALLGTGFLLFVLFIAMRWEGMTVTLLWLLTAVIVFVMGVALKKASFRIAAIVLMALTLGKLVAVDSLRFSAVQKVIAYVLLGVLLLIISFFYQKFKEKIFGDSDSAEPEK